MYGMPTTEEIKPEEKEKKGGRKNMPTTENNQNRI